MKKSFCTICTHDQIPQVMALQESLLPYDKDIILHVLMLDQEGRLPVKGIRFFGFRDMGEEGERVRDKYKGDPDKVRWAAKPVFLDFLLRAQGEDAVIYTDHDVYFFNDPSFLFSFFEKSSVILASCWKALDLAAHPATIRLNFRQGLLNTGFIGVHKKGLKVIRWWLGCCEHNLEKDFAEGIADDQRYFDLLPLLFEDVHVVEHQGLLVREWNRGLCSRESGGGQVIINGKWLVICVQFTPCFIEYIERGNDLLWAPYCNIYKKRVRKYTPSVQAAVDTKAVKSPEFPMALPGTFWGVTTFFNPAGYKNKLENYLLFRANTRRQGLNLVAVELAFGDVPFALTAKDADILVQLRGADKNVMWQKEALLNIGLKRLPADCDKVAWLDADIVFKNDQWIRETSALLERYVAVQPFSLTVRLGQGVLDLSDHEITALPSGYGDDEGQQRYGFSYAFLTEGSLAGHPGFAWAFRKELVLKYFFYDRLLFTGADTVMARLFSGTFEKEMNGWFRWNFNDKFFDHYLRWAEGVHQESRASMGYVSGTVMHLWHGNPNEKIYRFRQKMIELFDFDPKEDVRVSPEGLLEWASDKPKLQQMMKEYFDLRNEEGKNILTSLIINELYAVNETLAQTRLRFAQVRKSLEQANSERGKV